MSAQPIEANQGAFPAAAAIARRLRVVLNSAGRVAVSDGTDGAIGVTTNFTDALDDDQAVNFTSAASGEYIASATIAIGDLIYGAAAGEVGVTALTFNFVGIALTAAADTEIVHVLHTKLGVG